MARGMLSHLVLHKLAKGPLSGYGICSQIEVSIGHRPSYGSVYPLLEKLAHEGLVSARKDGRKKLYAITPKGREQVRRLDQRREELVGGLMVQVRSLMELTGQNPVPLVASLERLRGGEAPLGHLSYSMMGLRDVLFRMVQDGRAQRHKKEMNRMINEMATRMEALR